MKISRIVFFSLYCIGSVLFCLLLRYTVLPPLIAGSLSSGAAGGVHILADAGEFARVLDEYDGNLARIKAEKIAPPVYPENLPANLAGLPVPDKTSIFISLVLPNILRVNDEILETRQRVLRLLAKRERFQRLTYKEQWWLNRVAGAYGCDPFDNEGLLLRVDTIPPALALAQAIDESGWGTSRFALAGNALYGQHLPSDSSGPFIVSRRGNVKVAAFDSIYEATRSYMHSLNRVRAYAELRAQRANLKKSGENVTGHVLAGNLGRYSELGDHYVRDLRYLIEKYELERFNSVKLDPHSGKVVVQFERSQG